MNFDTLKNIVTCAIDETECWRQHARRWRALYDGDHWSAEERKQAKEDQQNLLTFNRIPLVVDNITGLEVNNRKEISYEALPPAHMMMGHNGGQGMDGGEAQLRHLSDVMNAALEHFREEADSEDAESSAFRDMIITGIGATETYIDYDEDPKGKMRDVIVDRECLIFDHAAVQRNLEDAAFVGHLKELTVSEAGRMFKDVPVYDLDACWVDGTDPDRRDINKIVDRVTIVHIQWREYEDIYQLVSTGEEVDADLAEAAEEDGRGYLVEKAGRRRVWKQAFLGARDILGSIEYAPSKNRPSINLMSYERDHSEDGSLWYGLVKRLESPQYAQNKFITKMVDASDHSGGGYFFEDDATDDFPALEKDLTNPARAKILKSGAIRSGKVMPVNPATPPLGADEMVAFSAASINDVIGAPPEVFGMADRNQPGVVENSRKQSAITSFASLFDRKKSYSRDKGRLQKDYIFAYLRDGRIIRKKDGGSSKFFPLTHHTLPDSVDFEVHVDEQSTSPDNKARTLATLPLLQAMFRGQLPLSMAMRFVPYLDLPAKLISDIMSDLQQPNPEQQAAQQAQQQAMQLETMKTQSEIAENNAQARHNDAQTVSELAQAAKWQAEAELQQQKTFNERLEPQFRAMDQVRSIASGR